MHPAAAGHLVPFPAGTGSGGWWRPRCLARSASSPAAAWPRCGTGRCYPRLAPGRHSPMEGLGAHGALPGLSSTQPRWCPGSFSGTAAVAGKCQPPCRLCCHGTAECPPPEGGLQCPLEHPRDGSAISTPVLRGGGGGQGQSKGALLLLSHFRGGGIVPEAKPQPLCRGLKFHC